MKMVVAMVVLQDPDSADLASSSHPSAADLASSSHPSASHIEDKMGIGWDGWASIWDGVASTRREVETNRGGEGARWCC